MARVTKDGDTIHGPEEFASLPWEKVRFGRGSDWKWGKGGYGYSDSQVWVMRYADSEEPETLGRILIEAWVFPDALVGMLEDVYAEGENKVRCAIRGALGL